MTLCFRSNLPKPLCQQLLPLTAWVVLPWVLASQSSHPHIVQPRSLRHISCNHSSAFYPLLWVTLSRLSHLMEPRFSPAPSNEHFSVNVVSSSTTSGLPAPSQSSSSCLSVHNTLCKITYLMMLMSPTRILLDIHLFQTAPMEFPVKPLIALLSRRQPQCSCSKHRIIPRLCPLQSFPPRVEWKPRMILTKHQSI